MDCSPPGSSVLGISQARVLDWVAMPSFRGLPNPGMERTSLTQAGSLPLAPPGEPLRYMCGQRRTLPCVDLGNQGQSNSHSDNHVWTTPNPPLRRLGETKVRATATVTTMCGQHRTLPCVDSGNQGQSNSHSDNNPRVFCKRLRGALYDSSSHQARYSSRRRLISQDHGPRCGGGPFFSFTKSKLLKV